MLKFPGQSTRRSKEEAKQDFELIPISMIYPNHTSQGNIFLRRVFGNLPTRFVRSDCCNQLTCAVAETGNMN